MVEIFRSATRVGPLFSLFRNEGCILGSVADPLRLVEAPEVRFTAGGGLTVNLPPHEPAAIYAYVEAGPRGGFIEAIEVCAADAIGFFKLCRMESTSRPHWQELLAAFRAQNVSPAGVSEIRKANHLYMPPAGGEAASPAALFLDRFCDLVVEDGTALEIIAPSAGARARLTLRPTHCARVGYWRVLCAGDAAFHLAPITVSELRVITRSHVTLLVLLGPKDQLLARILVRDVAVRAKLTAIL